MASSSSRQQSIIPVTIAQIRTCCTVKNGGGGDGGGISSMSGNILLGETYLYQIQLVARIADIQQTRGPAMFLMLDDCTGSCGALLFNETTPPESVDAEDIGNAGAGAVVEEEFGQRASFPFSVGDYVNVVAGVSQLERQRGSPPTRFHVDIPHVSAIRRVLDFNQVTHHALNCIYASIQRPTATATATAVVS
jgi:hypothetical protein